MAGIHDNRNMLYPNVVERDGENDDPMAGGDAANEAQVDLLRGTEKLAGGKSPPVKSNKWGVKWFKDEEDSPYKDNLKLPDDVIKYILHFFTSEKTKLTFI